MNTWTYPRIRLRGSIALGLLLSAGCSPDALIGGPALHPYDADVASLSGENSLYDNDDFVERSRQCTPGVGSAQIAIEELGELTKTTGDAGPVFSLLAPLPGSTERVVGDRVLEHIQTLTRRNCHYPDTYLLSAQVLLQLSQVPLADFNGNRSADDGRLIRLVSHNQGDLKRNRLAKLNSAIRAGVVANKIIATDREAQRPYMRFGYNTDGGFDTRTDTFVPLFSTRTKDIRPQTDSDLVLAYAEAEGYANWLLARSRIERADALWSSVFVTAHFDEEVVLPAIDEHGNMLGGRGMSVTLKRAIEKDYADAFNNLQNLVGYCGKVEFNVPSHLIGGCSQTQALLRSVLARQERLAQGYDFWGHKYLSASPAYANRRFAATVIQSNLSNINKAVSEVTKQRESLAQIHRLEGYVLDGDTLLKSKHSQRRVNIESLKAAEQNRKQSEAFLAARDSALALADDEVRFAKSRQQSQLHSYVGMRSKLRALEKLHANAKDALTDAEKYRQYVETEFKPGLLNLLANEKVALQRDWTANCSAGVRRALFNQKYLTETSCRLDSASVSEQVGNFCAKTNERTYDISRQCIARVETCPRISIFGSGCTTKRQWNTVRRTVWSPHAPLSVETIANQPNLKVYVGNKAYKLKDLIDKELSQPAETDCTVEVVKRDAARTVPQSSDSKDYLANRRICDVEQLYKVVIDSAANVSASCKLEALQAALAEVHLKGTEDELLRMSNTQKAPLYSAGGRSVRPAHVPNTPADTHALIDTVNAKWASYAEQVVNLQVRQAERKRHIAELNILIDEMLGDFNLDSATIDSWNALGESDRRARVDAHCKSLFASGSASGFPILRLVEAELRNVQVAADIRAREYQVVQDERSLEGRLLELTADIQNLNAEIIDREIVLNLPEKMITTIGDMAATGSVLPEQIDALANEFSGWKPHDVRRAEQMKDAAAAEREAAIAGMRRSVAEVDAQHESLKGVEQEIRHIEARQDDRLQGRAAFAYPSHNLTNIASYMDHAQKAMNHAAAIVRYLIRYSLQASLAGRNLGQDVKVADAIDACRYSYAFEDIQACLAVLEQTIVGDSKFFNFRNPRFYRIEITNPVMGISDLDTILGPSGGSNEFLLQDAKERANYEFIRSLMDVGSASLLLDPEGLARAIGHQGSLSETTLRIFDVANVMLVSANVHVRGGKQLPLSRMNMFAYRSGLKGQECELAKTRIAANLETLRREIPGTEANASTSNGKLFAAYQPSLLSTPLCEQVRSIPRGHVTNDVLVGRFRDDEVSLSWQHEAHGAPETAISYGGLAYGPWISVATTQNFDDVSAENAVSSLLQCLEASPISDCNKAAVQPVETRGIPLLGTWTFALGRPLFRSSELIEKVEIEFIVE